jgi:hypothetical protein
MRNLLNPSSLEVIRLRLLRLFGANPASLYLTAARTSILPTSLASRCGFRGLRRHAIPAAMILRQPKAGAA